MDMKKDYELEVENYVVYVTKKNIKNLYLRVRHPDAAVVVSAPIHMQDAQIVSFVKSRMNWIEEAQKSIQFQEENKAEDPFLVPFMEREYRYSLKRQIRSLLAKWEPVMGVQSDGFTIKKMKTRWGSCNVLSRHLNFNLALATMPECYVEYVVVHELTHLLEPSHNARFWKLMEEYLPNSKQLRKQLNDYVRK